MAAEIGVNLSAYACQLPWLQGLGVNETILRWLVDNKLAEHHLETTEPHHPLRSFHPSANLCFTHASCFIITPGGVAVAEDLAADDQPRKDQAHVQVNGHAPHYDSGCRTLLVGPKIVKQFKVRAENQELILLSFEEEKWPKFLADPLPGRKDLDAKRRLNEAIKNLNSRQLNRMIRFHGDGTGKGIVWEKLT